MSDGESGGGWQQINARRQGQGQGHGHAHGGGAGGGGGPPNHFMLAFEAATQFKYCQRQADMLKQCMEAKRKGLTVNPCDGHRQNYEACVKENGHRAFSHIMGTAVNRCPQQMQTLKACEETSGAESCKHERHLLLDCGAPPSPLPSALRMSLDSHAAVAELGCFAACVQAVTT